jgi:hypothetical protein
MMIGLFVQFDVTNHHVMVLRVCDFPENRHGEGRTVLTDSSGIAVNCVHSNGTVF